MAIVKLRDNRFGGNALCFKKEQSDGIVFSSKDNTEGLNNQKISGKEQKLLEQFGGVKMVELADKAGDAIVLLDGTHADDSDRKSQPFFTFKELNKKDNQGVDSFRLETGNLMGVLRFRDRKSGTSVQVEVLSRFDKRENNFFLNYLLSKVYDFALGAESISAQRSSFLEILLDIVFVRRLGEASKAGLLRHYREFRNNDWNFKGSLDLARHIRENIPLMHGIAYRKREIDLDVPVNRMILKAALTVNRRHPGFFEGKRDAADALRQLRMGVTEEHDLRRMLSHRDCREPVSHPFFREVWEPLRQIAKMILEDEQWTLFPEETTDDEVSGIVFDGSWLWEEYLATILSSKGYQHCVKGKSSDGMLYSLRNSRTGRSVGPMYPDFILKEDGKYLEVADAKYKQAILVRDDRLQMIAYAYVFEPKIVRVIYPPPTNDAEEQLRALESSSEDDQTDITQKQKPSKSNFEDRFSVCRNSLQKPNLDEETTIIQTISFGKNVPESSTVNDFANEMKKMETKFLEKMSPMAEGQCTGNATSERNNMTEKHVRNSTWRHEVGNMSN